MRDRLLSVDQATGPDIERTLRRRLSIPDDAPQVIVFAESSHWDPNWLRTSEEYFLLVRRNLDLALAELAREPRRVYSIECMFFLRMYWERCPEQRDTVRAMVNDGRLRLTSSGVTTADTLLPHPEALLRDFMVGQEWLRANGMTAEPRLAYFTDSFGCSPALPSLLHAAGFDQTALTRVDGMHFAGSDYETARSFPRPGSTAARLLEDERTLDFVWKGPDGAEVLCHWNAFTYGQGDMLAHRGISRMYLVPIAVPARSDRQVARQIETYASHLATYSLTPYLFCPIGFDFVPPIERLLDLLDRYNARHYPHSGLWAVNAGLDDYMALVECHRGRLPVLAVDPNPYWTGFYTSRPSLKRRCHDLVDDLLLAERLATLDPDPAAWHDVTRELEAAWWTAVSANHHDLITGTSPDRVVDAEQVPWLEQALAAGRTAVARRQADGTGAAPAVRRPGQPGRVEWGQDGGRLRVQTPYYAVELSECAGGTIVRAWDPTSGELLLDETSNDLIVYRESGGLWRMGHEFRGGSFRQIECASRHPARILAEERDGGLEVQCTVTLGGGSLQRRMWFAADSPLIGFRIEGKAAGRTTITARFETGLSAERLTMDAAGGLVERPRARIYEPTFWPLQHLLHVPAGEAAGRRGVALILARPGAAALRPNGRLEVVALRNATHERAFGLVPLPATPAAGHERERCSFDYGLAFCDDDQEAAALLPQALAALAAAWESAERLALRCLAAEAAHVDRPEVTVLACKPASRGDGLIVRLYTLLAAGAPVVVWLPGRPAVSAWLCDARERDLSEIEVRDGRASLIMPGSIASVRLML